VPRFAAGHEVPESVAEAVRLRITHPTLSLSDLGRRMQPPVSKNTVQAAQHGVGAPAMTGATELMNLAGVC
jgi:hypothetical protein